MGRRLLVTGSRKWTNKDRLEATLRGVLEQWGNPSDATLVVGGAAGADTLAEGFWRSLNLPVEVYPVSAQDWDKFGPAAGPMRNGRMVETGADLCVGFIQGESRGTRDCMRQARHSRIPVFEVRG